MDFKGKIINDPVYGFLRFPEPEVMAVIDHPWFQRLRHIKQMAMAHIVYPGAVHTRLHHSLGACYLMGEALEILNRKGCGLTPKDCLAARLAILMHDIGHGPFSHALEHTLVEGLTHETITMLIMQRMNKEMNGALSGAIKVFNRGYRKKYLHQLVSSQLDMDRMDYLSRDSFFTGVSEGVIGYDRILHMLTVHDNELMVEEKGVHSVEKFIVARRLMYMQVYLHKTVLSAEQLLIKILTRAKKLARNGTKLFATPALSYFLYQQISKEDFIANPDHLNQFCRLDDTDITASIKVWQNCDDFVLSKLCTMLIERKLYKIFLSSLPLHPMMEEKKQSIVKAWGLNEEDAGYFVFEGTTESSTYNTEDEKITIAMKDERFCDISAIDDALVNKSLAQPVYKNYICYART